MAETDEQEQEQGQEHESAEGKFEQEREQAREEMQELEEADELPEKLEDWPDGKAKYETFGGPEGESGYEDGPTSKLGPSSLRHHEDGEVSIEGEKVDNPEEYKGDPIPGGPTDPNAPEDVGVTKTSLERQEDEEGGGDSSGEERGDSESDDSERGEDSASSQPEAS